jgi:hypothetical protein
MQKIYDLFIDYFDNPIFTKMNNSSTVNTQGTLDKVSVYMCKLNINLANTYRYLVCITDLDAFFIGNEQPLSSLNWKVFQTRALNDNHDIRKHSYQPKKVFPYNSNITRTSIPNHNIETETKYISDIFNNLDITLLPNKDSIYSYPEKGKFNSALETYNTIIILL